MLPNNLSITAISKCKCGCLSVQFSNGAWNTMRPSTFKKEIGAMPKGIEVQPLYACNACVNHWSVENGEEKLFQQRQFVGWVR